MTDSQSCHQLGCARTQLLAPDIIVIIIPLQCQQPSLSSPPSLMDNDAIQELVGFFKECKEDKLKEKKKKVV
jgi:hypothetical protein